MHDLIFCLVQNLALSDHSWQAQRNGMGYRNWAHIMQMPYLLIVLSRWPPSMLFFTGLKDPVR